MNPTQQPAAPDPQAPHLHVRDTMERTAAVKGDWLALIQAHHAMIESAFNDVLSSADASSRAQAHKRLSYLLTAHSVAEENTVYPVLAIHGLIQESDKLYLDQAHAKVMNAVLDLADDKGSEAWLERAQSLKSAVLLHAKQDEEGDLYPRLQAALDLTTASRLASAYRREFLSVQPG